MTPEQEAKTFFFESNPVGCFSGDLLPAAPGRYKYVPYRGPGHYKLGLALSSHGPQSCHYLLNDRLRNFTVQSIPEYGILEIATFA